MGRVTSNVTVFPFDLFGSAGTGAGAQLLGEAVGEILDDTDRETRPCRAACLKDAVELHEFTFESMTEVRDWRKTARQTARKAFKAGQFLLWLGGNHLSVLPVLEELGKEALVIQFDAHLDLYDFHDTTRELSHGNFLKHFEGPRPRLVNVGHRDLFLTHPDITKIFESVHSAEEIASDVHRIAVELRSLAREAKHVWIDIDCDVFDPSAMPAVQQPLPFGLSSLIMLKLFNSVWCRQLLGVSISEFDPGRDVRDAGLNLLGWLIESVLLKVGEAGE